MTHVNIADAAAALKPFVAGGRFYPDVRNFRGGPPEDREDAVGRLPVAWCEQYEEDRDGIDYVVYSYYTPIAWHIEDGPWVVPPVRYSPSTTQHQKHLAVLIES